MRRDWERRARLAPAYYVALSSDNQPSELFFRGAEELVWGLENELRRIATSAVPEARRALEIGCGPGRLMLPLSRRFGEIHGVDVSRKMVRLARQSLTGVSHAHVHTSEGTNLAQFGDDFFDFVYSFAVFQHIPSRDVVYNYLAETRRVLKTGGVARPQFNGLPANGAEYDTWCGVRFASEELASYARDHDLPLLALEGANTQYMWATLRKPGAGWKNELSTADVVIRRVTNSAFSGPVVPVRGRFANFALWVEGLGPNVDLNTFRIFVADRQARLTFLGMPHQDGLRQITAMLPRGVPSGLLPVRLVCEPTGVEWCGCFLRAVPPGPAVPGIVAVTDSIFVGGGRTISSGMVRVYVEEAQRPEDLEAWLDGQPLRRAGVACTVPDIPRFEVDFRLPTWVKPGKKQLAVRLGKRTLGAFEIVVNSDRFWWRKMLHPAEVYRVLRQRFFTSAHRAIPDSGTRPD